jgi:hypothetical protein
VLTALLLSPLLQALVTELRNDEDDWTVTDAKIARKNAEIGELRERITIYEALDKVNLSFNKV